MSYILQSKTSKLFLAPSTDIRGYQYLVESKWGFNPETDVFECQVWKFPTLQAAQMVANAINGTKHLNLVPVSFGEVRCASKPVKTKEAKAKKAETKSPFGTSFGALLQSFLDNLEESVKESMAVAA